MKCVILAAGYATRLYPLTKDRPKALLEVGGKAILQHLLEKIEQVPLIEKVIIVTNDPFFKSFKDWIKGASSLIDIQVLSDGTTTNENRLGAVADLQFTIEEQQIEEDLLVLAGDNLFDFSLADFVSFYKRVNRDCITTHVIDNEERIKRTGVIEKDEGGKVISFEEKPLHPKSRLAVPPFYVYKKETLPLIKRYLQEGNNKDAPGNFIPWLIKHHEVYAYQFEGERYDIGTLESYQEVQELYGVKEVRSL